MSERVSLITASYWRDFDSCRLLCDSIDAFVTGYERHFIVVASEDVAQFRQLAGSKRQIVDAADIIPLKLTKLPVRWRGRQYHKPPGFALPVYGWHLQQVRKIAMTLAQPEPRVLHMDSDICFVRPFDVATFAGGNRVPLWAEPDAIDDRLPEHKRWCESGHRLLGLGPAAFPGTDYVGQMIAWEKASVAEMTASIERTTGRAWAEAILRARHFSEYILYGLAVANAPDLARRHMLASQSPCHVYWNGPALDAAGLAAFAAEMRADQSAIAIQSFTGTPTQVLRDFALGQRARAIA